MGNGEQGSNFLSTEVMSIKMLFLGRALHVLCVA